MKIVIDKYGRKWIKKYSTYILLTINNSGMLNLKKITAIILFTSLSYGQSSIVAAGSENITIGEVFPIMQQNLKEKDVSLGVPKFEIPIEKPKQIKKISWLGRLILIIKKLFK